MDELVQLTAECPGCGQTVDVEVGCSNEDICGNFRCIVEHVDPCNFEESCPGSGASVN